jgi:hypothetical protein
MHLKIIVVVVLAALVAAGLGYGLLNLKDRNVEKGAVAPQQVASVPQAPEMPPGADPAGNPVPMPPLAPPPMPQQGGMPQPGAAGIPMMPQTAMAPNMTPGMAPGMVPPPMAGTPGIGGDPDKDPPLPPLALMQMPLQNKQAYFDFMLKINGQQKDLSSYYFASLNTLDMIYREMTMRQMSIIQSTSNMGMGGMNMMAGAPMGSDPSQLMRTLEEQQKEVERLQGQLTKTIAARKALLDSLSKEQEKKIKPYLDAKIF